MRKGEKKKKTFPRVTKVIAKINPDGICDSDYFYLEVTIPKHTENLRFKLFQLNGRSGRGFREFELSNHPSYRDNARSVTYEYRCGTSNLEVGSEYLIVIYDEDRIVGSTKMLYLGK